MFFNFACVRMMVRRQQLIERAFAVGSVDAPGRGIDPPDCELASHIVREDDAHDTLSDLKNDRQRRLCKRTDMERFRQRAATVGGWS